MVIFSRFDYDWIHKPLFSLRTTFFHFSHQLQKRISEIFLCFGVNERPIPYQPYAGIYIICTSVTAIFYHLVLKIQSPIRGVHYTVEKPKWYPFINWWYKNKQSKYDMKQSVVSIGSQYRFVWQALSNVKESLIQLFSYSSLYLML